MQATNGLEIVFRNPQPKREPHYPNLWSLLVSDQRLRVFVVQDGTLVPMLLGGKRRNPDRYRQGAL